MQNSRYRFFWLYVVIFLHTVSNPVLAQKPQEFYSAVQYAPKISEINFPVQMSLADIEAQINKQVGKLLYESLENMLEVKVWKLDKITLQGKENSSEIKIAVPLKVRLDGVLQANVLGLEVRESIGKDFMLKVSLATEIYLTKDWQVRTRTKLDKYDWLETPALELGPIKIPITAIVDKVIKYQQTSITRQLDEQLGQIIPLKSQVEATWRTFQEPFMISEFQKDTIWMAMKPTDLSISIPVFKDNILTTQVNLNTYANAVWGKKPQGLTIKKLPVLQYQSKKPEKFKLVVKCELSHDFAAEKAKAMFVNQAYTYKKTTAVVKDLDIYGSGEQIVIRLLLEGDVKAVLFIFGKPVYDRKNQLLQIENLNYAIDTKSKFLKFAKWLFNGKIRRNIEQSVEQPINAQIQAVRAEIKKNLSNYALNPTTILNGTLNDFHLDKIFMTKDAVITEFVMDGRFGIRLKGFE